MALKGHKFSLEDTLLPRGLRRYPEARQQEWVDKQNEEYAVVAECTLCPPLADDTPRKLIAREVEPHYLSHIESTRVRQIAGMVMHIKTKRGDVEELIKFCQFWLKNHDFDA